MPLRNTIPLPPNEHPPPRTYTEPPPLLKTKRYINKHNFAARNLQSTNEFLEKKKKRMIEEI
jgi:hypothetical protein